MNTSKGMNDHQVVQIIERVALACRQNGYPEREALRTGVYAALRFGGVPKERASREADELTRKAGAP